MRNRSTGLALLASAATSSPALADTTGTVTITNGTTTPGGGTLFKLIILTFEDAVTGTTESCASPSGTFTAPSGTTNGTYPFQPTGTVINSLQAFPVGGSCTGVTTFTSVTISVPTGGAPLYVAGPTVSNQTNPAGLKTPVYLQGITVTAVTGTGCKVVLDGSTHGASKIGGVINNRTTGINFLMLGSRYGGDGDDLVVTDTGGCGNLFSTGDAVTVTGIFTIANGSGTTLTAIAS